MTDKIMGVLALTVLGGFLAILVGFVPRIDLIAVVTLTFGLAATDLVITITRRK